MEGRETRTLKVLGMAQLVGQTDRYTHSHAGTDTKWAGTGFASLGKKTQKTIRKTHAPSINHTSASTHGRISEPAIRVLCLGPASTEGLTACLKPLSCSPCELQSTFELCILNIMCHLPCSWETKSSNERYRDEIWVADVEPGKGTETSSWSWNTTSKTCFPLTFQSAVPQVIGEKRNCCFSFLPPTLLLILYFWTILYSLLSLIICTAL